MTARVARGDASRRRAMASSSSSSSSDDLDFGGVGARASARTRIGAREDARDGDALFWGGALSELPARRRRDDAGARAKKPRPSRSVSSSSSSASLRSSAAAVGGGSTLGGGSSRVLGRGSSSVVTRGEDARRATKRIRADDRAMAVQAKREMWTFQRISSSSVNARFDRNGDVEGWSSLTARGALGVDPTAAEDDEETESAPTYEGLVRCFGFGYDAVKNEVSITLELMHFGSLEDVVRSRGSMRFAPRAAMCAARCVANGLAYLHDTLEIVHRDVKPSNVLINECGECKLSDFGLCTPFTGGDVEDDAHDSLGTIMYMSPERLESSAARCGPEADVWGMGLTVLESVMGKHVFDIEDGGPLGLVIQIMDDDIDVAGAVDGEDAVSNALRALLSACLRKDHTKRITASELIDASPTSTYRELKLNSYTCADMRQYLYPPRRGESKVTKVVVEERTTSRESTPFRFDE